MEEMIYTRHRTPVGVKVEEISGGEGMSRRVWEMMAHQIYNENGKSGEYRAIDHLPCGAPVLAGSDERITVSHTPRLMVVATLPRTPETGLDHFSRRTAVGIDVEKSTRKVSDEVADRVLSPAEKEMAAAAGSLGPITAWTCKEALYKAVLGGGGDWRDGYTILTMPDPARGTLGSAEVRMPDGTVESFMLYSYLTAPEEEGLGADTRISADSGKDGVYVVTIALSPQAATFRKDK